MQPSTISIIFNIVTILYLIYIVLQVIVGLFLLNKMKKTRLRNLLPLSLFFLLNAIEGFLALIEAPILILQLIKFLPNICLILFTKYTFYQDRKSSFKIILSLVVILKFLNFLLTLYIPFEIPMRMELTNEQIPYYYLYLSMISIIILLSELWLAYSSLNYYKSVKNISIEPWIKKRYLIIGICTLILSSEGIVWLFMPWTTEGYYNPQGLIVGFIVIIVFVTFSVGSVIGWMMPQKLRNYFNKGFQPIKEESLSENELIEKIISELTNRGV